jgi:hypothetical protein
MHTSEYLKEKEHSEDLGVDVNTLECILGEQGGKVVDLMHLDHNRDQWQALVNKVMNLRGIS